MSSLYRYKPQKDLLLRPLFGGLMSIGATPNMVTASGLVLSVIAGILAASGQLYLGILLFIIGACLDALDGSYARVCGMCTEFGRYFDSVCDRLSELAFVTGAVIGGSPESAFVVVAGSLVLMGSRIYNHQKGFRSDAARFSRPERLVLLVAGLMAPDPYSTMLFLGAGLLSLVSAAQVLASGVRMRNDRMAVRKVR